MLSPLHAMLDERVMEITLVSICPRNTPVTYFSSAKTLNLAEKTRCTAPPRGFLGHELVNYNLVNAPNLNLRTFVAVKDLR